LRIVLLDHELYRLGLRRVLEAFSDCEVVGEAGTARAGFKLISTVGPDVVVIDPALRGLGSGNAIRKIRGCAPGVRVLVLTEHGRVRDVAMAIASGASGYALKGDSLDEILNAVHRVHLGRLYLSPGLDPGRDVSVDATPTITSQEMAG
jgi:DNA-binding NarL/FixJ family response regulator